MAGIIQKTNTTINKDSDGNIISEEITVDSSVIQKSDEGDYIKVYFSELDKLPDILTMSSFRLLLQLSKYSSYSDVNDLEGGMLVQLTSLVREEIQNTLGIKKRTFYDNMKNLITCNLIREVRKSCYQLNPLLLGRGYYEYKPNYKQGGIKDLREYWKMGCKQREVVIEDNRYLLFELLEEVKKLSSELRKSEKEKDYKKMKEIKPELSKFLKGLNELSKTEYTKYVKYLVECDDKIKEHEQDEEEIQEEPLQISDDFSWFERNIDINEFTDEQIYGEI